MQEGWQAASDSDADVHLEGDELNPHFSYDDEDKHVRHQVWMLDAVTAVERVARRTPIGPGDLRSVAAWARRIPRYGRYGTIRATRMPLNCYVRSRPEMMWTLTVKGTFCASPACRIGARGRSRWTRRTWTLIDEHMQVYPQPYTIQYLGYKPGEVALSFR